MNQFETNKTEQKKTGLELVQQNNEKSTEEKSNLESIRQKDEQINAQITSAQEKVKQLGGIDKALEKLRSYEKQKSGGKAFSGVGLALLGGVSLLALSPAVPTGAIVAGAAAGAIGIGSLGIGAYKGIKGWWESRKIKKSINDGHSSEAYRINTEGTY